MNNNLYETVCGICPHFRQQPVEKVSRWADSYLSLPFISNKDYFRLHKDILTPTTFKVDVDQFTNEIEPYLQKFKHWGDKYWDQNRLGLPLVNITGELDEKNDPSTMPLDEHFSEYQTDIIYHDPDIKEKTEICDLPSLEVLEPLFPYLIRSSILWWDKGAGFSKHIDVFLPATNLRLWGTTKPIDCHFEGFEIPEIEPGRLYVIDTSKPHWGSALFDNTYQFFLSLQLEAFTVIEKNLLPS